MYYKFKTFIFSTCDILSIYDIVDKKYSTIAQNVNERQFCATKLPVQRRREEINKKVAIK